VLVTGAGGFIGHHLVSFLKEQGYWVRGVDLKRPEYAPTAADEFQLLDLRRRESCLEATLGIEEVYALAADMGGMGFISSHHAQILLTRVEELTNDMRPEESGSPGDEDLFFDFCDCFLLRHRFLYRRDAENGMCQSPVPKKALRLRVSAVKVISTSSGSDEPRC